MSELQIGLWGIAFLFLLLASSMPVGFAMTLVGLIGFAAVVNVPAALNVLVTDYYDVFSSYGLTVIPLFVFMGQVAFHAGISKKLFAAAHCWFGWLRGGLAMATVGACTAFGAICGSGPATAATMAAVALPEMKRYKYDSGFAAGTVAAAGSIGMMIPPSIVFIVYGVMTEQSIGKLFIAGIVPGLMIAAMFMATIWLMCKWRPALAPAATVATWRERFRSLTGVTETLLLFALVMGGMFAGWFTPTEAAAIGAAGSVAVALFARKCSFRMLATALNETLCTSCMVLVIVAGATVFGHFLQITNVPTELAAWMAGLPLPPWGIMLLMIFFYLIAGMFLDALAVVMLTIPIFYPVVVNLGFDPIWFGVIIVLTTQMGVISPPVGVNVYVVSGMDRAVPLQAVFKGALPFLAALIVAAVVLVAFPEVVTVPTSWVK
jgi:tripartite ATP-independent transporter DctM subunit